MSAILPLIEDAIDVPLMDVKNISKLIHSYIEYDEYEGPQYDIFMELYQPYYDPQINDGERTIDTVYWYVFIFENQPLVVSKVEERILAEDGGITFNGIHYDRNWFAYPVLEKWFYDRVMSIRGYSYMGRSLESYFMYGLRYRDRISMCQEWRKFHKEDDWVKKIKEAKRRPTKKQFEKLMFEKVLEPFVDFYIEKIMNL